MHIGGCEPTPFAKRDCPLSSSAGAPSIRPKATERRHRDARHSTQISYVKASRCDSVKKRYRCRASARACPSQPRLLLPQTTQNCGYEKIDVLRWEPVHAETQAVHVCITKQALGWGDGPLQPRKQGAAILAATRKRLPAWKCRRCSDERTVHPFSQVAADLSPLRVAPRYTASEVSPSCSLKKNWGKH